MLLREFRCWNHLLNVGARRWYKQIVDVDDQNEQNRIHYGQTVTNTQLDCHHYLRIVTNTSGNDLRENWILTVPVRRFRTRFYKNESSSRWTLMIFNLRNRPVRFLFLFHWIIFWTYVLSYNWNHSKSRKFWNFTLEINFLTLNLAGHIFKQFKISTFDLPYQWLIELKITIFERDYGKGV